jgi:hypothetical protein
MGMAILLSVPHKQQAFTPKGLFTSSSKRNEVQNQRPRQDIRQQKRTLIECVNEALLKKIL